MHTQAAPAYVNVIILAVIALVLSLRLRSMRRSRRLRLETLWVVPALYAIVTAAVLYEAPPQGMQWLWLGIAVLLGIVLGWRRGALMRIGVDPATHALNQQASPAAMLFILALIVLRQALRMEAGALGFDLAFLTDLLMVFALGLFSATRAEMFLRGRRLLDEARAGV